jgi:hypothetical protein
MYGSEFCRVDLRLAHESRLNAGWKKHVKEKQTTCLEKLSGSASNILGELAYEVSRVVIK